MGHKGERGEWGNQVEFLLACVGYAVGLGNIWRFPYLTFDNGGAAFLIPYVISLIIAGLPVFYLELCLGQFSSLGPNCIFGKLVPLLQGIGWGMVTVSFLVSIYYNIIIAWILIYFVLSFRGTMMWSSCSKPWNTINCMSTLDDERCMESNEDTPFYFNFSCISNNSAQYTAMTDHFKDHVNISTNLRTGPAEEFFENYILDKTATMEVFGGMNWMMVGGLFAAWVIIAMCLIKGVQSTGKVVYFTATFPYVVLVILLIRGFTLPGMFVGIKYYILEPKAEKFFDAKVWQAAATQIFYSLGAGFGSLLTMASYNKFKNNCFRDAVFVAFTNCGTSVLAGFAIFSILGFMATEQKVEKFENVVQSGTGLAFIAYPEAISRMPAAPYIWAILFFFMLFTLGLDSQFAMVETVTTAAMDQFTYLRRYKSTCVMVTCFVMFLLGLPMCTRSGIFYFSVFDGYSASISLVFIAFLEFIAAIHIYGLNRLVADVQMMLGAPRSPIGWAVGPTGWYFRVTWFSLAPLFLLVIFIGSLVDQFGTKLSYGKKSNKYYYPGWAMAFGWLLSLASLVWLPVFFIYRLFRNQQKGKTFSDGWRSRDDWCPAHEREKKLAASPYIVKPISNPTNGITSFTVNDEYRQPHAYSNEAFHGSTNNNDNFRMTEKF